MHALRRRSRARARRGRAASTSSAARARFPSSGATLRERFGRRVHRSPYPFAAVAIGLAIAADERAAEFALVDRSRARSASSARRTAGATSPSTRSSAPSAELPARAKRGAAHERVYRAAHNVGHFRFVECGAVSTNGAPAGDMTPFGDVVFPFDPPSATPTFAARAGRRIGRRPADRRALRASTRAASSRSSSPTWTTATSARIASARHRRHTTNRSLSGVSSPRGGSAGVPLGASRRLRRGIRLHVHGLGVEVEPERGRRRAGRCTRRGQRLRLRPLRAAGRDARKSRLLAAQHLHELRHGRRRRPRRHGRRARARVSLRSFPRRAECVRRDAAGHRWVVILREGQSRDGPVGCLERRVPRRVSEGVRRALWRRARGARFRRRARAQPGEHQRLGRSTHEGQSPGRSSRLAR